MEIHWNIFWDICSYVLFFDLFGIFLTLDHTFKPHQILKFALTNSKFVIIQAHLNREMGRQHLFTITKDFSQFLKSMGVFTINLTNQVKQNVQKKTIIYSCYKI